MYKQLYVLAVWVSNFWRKESGTKAADKIFVKPTTGLNFNKILH